MSGTQDRGRCEGCDKEPRVLTRIQSGQRVCRTCLREIRALSARQWAMPEDVQLLRTRGFDVPDQLPQVECERLRMLDLLRSHGLAIPTDASARDVQRLAKWLGLHTRPPRLRDPAATSWAA